jgi:hypothetical protein
MLEGRGLDLVVRTRKTQADMLNSTYEVVVITIITLNMKQSWHHNQAMPLSISVSLNGSISHDARRRSHDELFLMRLQRNGEGRRKLAKPVVCRGEGVGKGTKQPPCPETRREDRRKKKAAEKDWEVASREL